MTMGLRKSDSADMSERIRQTVLSILSLQFRLDIEVESTRKVKVKAHTRVVNGKTVKVRSHYRSI